jgi:Rps23 Pro-64 3,4-dihydroxylase Tpa1-like proline 4-hydroxylase
MKNEFIAQIKEKLSQNIDQLTRQYREGHTGTRTKFFILDNLIDNESVKSIYKQFDGDYWILQDTFREKKLTYAKLDNLDSILSNITEAFHNKEIVSLVSKITGVNNLEYDPSLYAGGISKMRKGDFLNPHIDNSHDGGRKRYRRLNLLFYVSPGLEEKHGGNFELWDDKVKYPVKIPAKFNRLVVMETGDHTWHSVDEVKTDLSRCCVSNYYFSESSPRKFEYYHVTSFNGRPNQPLTRMYSSIDNFFRQSFVKLTGFSRGKEQARKV